MRRWARGLFDLAAGAAEPFSLRQVSLWRNPFIERERGGYAAPTVTGSTGTSGGMPGTFIPTVRLRCPLRQRIPSQRPGGRRLLRRPAGLLRGRHRVIATAGESRPRAVRPRLPPRRFLNPLQFPLPPRHRRRNGRIRASPDPRGPSNIRLSFTSPNRSLPPRGRPARKSSSPTGGSEWARSSSTCS